MGDEMNRAMRVCGRLAEGGQCVTLELAGGRIGTIHNGPAAGALGGTDVMLAPGFHDLQVNGFAGNDFNGGSWGLGAAAEADFGALRCALAKHGIALFCPTIITDSPERMLSNLRKLARALERDAGLARSVTGIHLEGPFISAEEGPRGAHPVEHIRAPDIALFDRFQEAAEGRIRICTMAPELQAATDLIERLVARGVVVAIGHTAASAAQIRDAVAAGATLSTHIGNGCHARIPRHDCYLWEQLACDALTATMIVDGWHVEPSEAKVFVRAKGPGRVALISDVVALGGMPPGMYGEGRFEVTPEGRILLAGTPYLAGASALLDTCAANASRWTDMSLGDVVRSVTETPARALGLAQKGRIEEGLDADLTLFRPTDTGPFEIVATICGGEVI